MRVSKPKGQQGQKARKRKSQRGPRIFPEVGERIRDKTGKFSGTVRYVGTVHTSKNEHLNWVGVEWDDRSREA